MIDLLCAFVAMLASAAFAQFGVTLKSQDKAPTPEVHRTTSQDHGRQPATSLTPGLTPGQGVVRLPSTALPQPRFPAVGQKGG